MKKHIFPFLIIILSLACSKTQDLQTASIAAGSMVCESCAKTIDKALRHVDGVKEVSVDQEKKIVQVKFVPAQTNLESLEKAMTAAGYDANDRKRDAVAYEKLPSCCKINS